MQLVDPFIPAGPNPRRQPTPPRPARKNPPQASVDGFRPHPQYRAARPAAAFVHPRTSPTQQPKPHRPSVSHPQPATTQISKPQPKAASVPKKRSKGRKLLASLGQALGIMAAVALGFLVQSPIIGQAAILLYGIFALIFRVSSRTTFLLALMSLGVVLVGSVRSNTVLASTFAIYAFLFLGIGTLSLARELRNEI